MERHEIDAELNTPGAQELLAATSAAHLAYVGSDATPRVIPVGYWWTGEQFVISTATTSPKVAALSAVRTLRWPSTPTLRPAGRGRCLCAGGRRSRSWRGWSRNT